MNRTTIEWCTWSWNPLRGTLGNWACQRVSPGCQHCYAERRNMRFGGPAYTFDADTPRLHLPAFDQLRRAAARRERGLVFVCSMTDLFWEQYHRDWIDRVFAAMAAAPELTFLVLTKRSKRMADYIRDPGTPYAVARWVISGDRLDPSARMVTRARIDNWWEPDEARWGLDKFWPLPNVWLGVSVESQSYARRIDDMVDTPIGPGCARFVSAEPLLGPLNLAPWLVDTEGAPRGWLHWVIAGGESGGPPERRLRNNPAAVASLPGLIADCRRAGVAFFFKQWGGKYSSQAGRLVDGITYDEIPDGQGGITTMSAAPNDRRETTFDVDSSGTYTTAQRADARQAEAIG